MLASAEQPDLHPHYQLSKIKNGQKNPFFSVSKILMLSNLVLYMMQKKVTAFKKLVSDTHFALLYNTFVQNF